MKINKKFIYPVFIVLIALAIFIWSVVSAYQDNNLYVYFLDIGQGDSVYIRTPQKHDIVIDGGPDNLVLSKIGKYMPFYDRKIELMILTHPHEDHINGLIEIVKRYNVEQILSSDAEYDSAAYYEWNRLIAQKNISKVEAITDQEIRMGNTIFNVFYPDADLTGTNIKNINNASIVGQLVYGETKILFTGDAEKEVENKLVENIGLDLDSDILKVGHHGSKTASTKKLINLVNPGVSIISAGVNNRYKHPHKETIVILEEYNSQIYRTDYHGDIKCWSDGNNFGCEQEKL